MASPFHSAEIRWFSQDKDFIKALYDHCPGAGNKESDRTDYYLNYQGTDTGVKIRQGRHEIKVLNTERIVHSKGIIEQWSKWSTAEDQNILNTIPKAHQSQWIAIEKERYKKKYRWNPSIQRMEYSEGWITDGCGVEFTILSVLGESWYTFGLEAFGTYRLPLQNLIDTLNIIELPDIDSGIHPSYSYPEFIIERLK